MMYYYDELSVSEISEALECPEGTVKSRLFSSRKIMRDELERKGIKSGIAAFAVSAVLKSDIEAAETVECSVVKKGVSKAAAVKIFSNAEYLTNQQFSVMQPASSREQYMDSAAQLQKNMRKNSGIILQHFILQAIWTEMT